jgi:hypothetical protein
MATSKTNDPLVRVAAGLGGAAMRERRLTEEEEDERSERAIRLNLAQHLVPRGVSRRGPPEQLAQLGTMPRTTRPVNWL